MDQCNLCAGRGRIESSIYNPRRVHVLGALWDHGDAKASCGKASSHRDLKQPATMVAPAVTVQLRNSMRLTAARANTAPCSRQSSGITRRSTASRLTAKSGLASSGSTTAGASSFNRDKRRACVTSMPSAAAISVIDRDLPSSSNRCQQCASPSARIKGVFCAALRLPNAIAYFLLQKNSFTSKNCHQFL